MADIPFTARCSSCAHRRVSRDRDNPYCACTMETLAFVDQYGEPLMHTDCGSYVNEVEDKSWKPRN